MFHQVPTTESLNIIKSASEANLVVFYRRILLKLTYTNNHLWFNKQCKKFKVFPNYINIKCNNTSKPAIDAIKTAKQQWLKNEMKVLFHKRDNLNLHLYLIHSKLGHFMNP